MRFNYRHLVVHGIKDRKFYIGKAYAYGFWLEIRVMFATLDQSKFPES